MARNTSLTSVAFILGLNAFTHVALAEETAYTDYQQRPAIFNITADVVNEDVEAFTFTGPGFSNTLKPDGRGSFEPVIYRDKMRVEQDADNRIVLDTPKMISGYDSWSSGFLDGADVQVYRIVNGELKMVRSDVVAPGGSVLSDWFDSLSVDASSSEAQFKINGWERVGTDFWLAVCAVDEKGNASAPSNAVKIERRYGAKKAKPVYKKWQGRAKKWLKDEVAPATPLNFQASYNEDDLLELSWEPVADEDVVRYQIVYSYVDPAEHQGTFLQLAGKAGSDEEKIRTGDQVIVSKSLDEWSTDMLSDRVANLGTMLTKFTPSSVPSDIAGQPLSERTWKLAKYSADAEVKNAGEYYLELTTQAGETQYVGQHGIPDISNTQQSFYPVPEDGAEYVMNVWMKADSNSRAPVVFTYKGDAQIGGFVGRTELAVTTEWKQYEVRFTGKSSEKGFHAYLVLEVNGPGTYSFDNFRVYRADTAYLDYLPEDYAALKQSGMAAFRTHGPIKTFRNTYSMRQFLGSAGEVQGIKGGSSLSQLLEMMVKAEMQPWLQIEYHMSPDEWLAFMEYMAAPYDPSVDSIATKPYAALRYGQGHHEPWTDVFDTIYFEVSNETWNSLFAPWVFGSETDAATGEKYARGEVYAMWHDFVVRTLRTSPYWKPEFEDKFQHVLGGWALTLSRSTLENGFTQEMAKRTQEGDFITIAGYNGGWDEGEGVPSAKPVNYFGILNQVSQVMIPRMDTFSKIGEIASKRLGREVKFGSYESGPGYAVNGLNGAKVTKEQRYEQETVMKSKLAGVATLDSFLARVRWGSDIENFFTFNRGENFVSHALLRNGGQPHACIVPLELFNAVGTGDMLYVDAKSVSTVDMPKSKRKVEVDNSQLATVYATREGDRVTVFAINRKVANYPDASDDGYTPFGLELPFTKADKVTLYRMTGAPTDHNIVKENVKIESMLIDPKALGDNGRFVIGPATGGDAKGMPPSEMFCYVFEGINIKDGRVLSTAEVREQSYTFEETE